MSIQIRVIEEADGSIFLEIETGDVDMSFEINVDEASDLHSDLGALLQDRYYREPSDD